MFTSKLTMQKDIKNASTCIASNVCNQMKPEEPAVVIRATLVKYR